MNFLVCILLLCNIVIAKEFIQTETDKEDVSRTVANISEGAVVYIPKSAESSETTSFFNVDQSGIDDTVTASDVVHESSDNESTLTLRSNLHSANEKINSLETQIEFLTNQMKKAVASFEVRIKEFETNGNTEVRSCDLTLTELEHSRQVLESCDERVERLGELLVVAEKNISMLETKVKLTKNEKIIARTSQENCVIELQTARQVHAEETAALQKELTSTKAQLIQQKQSPKAVKVTSDSESNSCNVATCMDSFVSEYIFYWAEEHQKHDLANVVNHSEGRNNQAGQFSNVVSIVQTVSLSVLYMYNNYIHPIVSAVLVNQFRFMQLVTVTVYNGVVTVWMKIIQPILSQHILPTLHSLYTSHLQSVLEVSLLPWYKLHVLPNLTELYRYYLSSGWNIVVNEYIHDPIDYIMGMGHYITYYSVRLFESSDIFGEIVIIVNSQYNILQTIVLNIVQYIASTETVQAVIGAKYATTAASLFVTSIVLIIIYLARRIVIGIASAILILLLFPTLFVVYLTAKTFSYCLSPPPPHRKAKSTTKRSAISSHHRSSKDKNKVSSSSASVAAAGGDNSTVAREQDNTTTATASRSHRKSSSSSSSVVGDKKTDPSTSSSGSMSRRRKTADTTASTSTTTTAS